MPPPSIGIFDICIEKAIEPYPTKVLPLPLIPSGGMVMEQIFVNANVRMADIDLFLQGFPANHPFMRQPEFRHMLAADIVWSSFQPHETMAHLVHRAGLFKSTGEARRNGWARPVPTGFSQFKIGKRKSEIFVLNLVDEN